jgi:hypothetical protein
MWKWCGSKRCNIYVRIHRGPQQAVSRRYEWNRTDNNLDSAHGRTSCCSVAVRILIGKQRLGRKFRVCGVARYCVGWVGRRCAASE